MTSYRLFIDPRRGAAARLIGRVRDELQKALVEEKSKRRITQQEIATRLNVHRSVVNRHFTGSENLTLRTIAELAWALGREVEFRMPPTTDAPGSNAATSVTVEVLDDEPGAPPRSGGGTSTSDEVCEVEPSK